MTRCTSQCASAPSTAAAWTCLSRTHNSAASRSALPSRGCPIYPRTTPTRRSARARPRCPTETAATADACLVQLGRRRRRPPPPRPSGPSTRCSLPRPWLWHRASRGPTPTATTRRPPARHCSGGPLRRSCAPGPSPSLSHAPSPPPPPPPNPPPPGPPPATRRTAPRPLSRSRLRARPAASSPSCTCCAPSSTLRRRSGSASSPRGSPPPSPTAPSPARRSPTASSCAASS
mmetsp:Transcript_37105/g.116677  ORF Transcript_37105/g.116677 Transcript_37105/m.116677 type:complete len:232 (+) Transcript_37105:151-846(+)